MTGGIHPRADDVLAAGLAHGDVLGHGAARVLEDPVPGHPGTVFAGGFHELLIDFQGRQAVSRPLVVRVGNDIRFDGKQFVIVFLRFAVFSAVFSAEALSSAFASFSRPFLGSRRFLGRRGIFDLNRRGRRSFFDGLFRFGQGQ